MLKKVISIIGNYLVSIGKNYTGGNKLGGTGKLFWKHLVIKKGCKIIKSMLKNNYFKTRKIRHGILLPHPVNDNQLIWKESKDRL